MKKVTKQNTGARVDDLTDAYGRASDTKNGGKTVMQLLDGIRSTNARTRAHSVEWLWARICHQGSVYSASLACVPSLVSQVCRRGAPDRHQILDLLTGLAIGDPTNYVGGGPDGFSVPRGSGVEAKCYRAVKTAAPAIRRLLEDDDARVRTEAAGLLAWFADAKNSRALRERVRKETHSAARSAAILALGIHARKSDSALCEALVSAEDHVVAAAAAIARASISPRVPASVRAVIERAQRSRDLQRSGPFGEKLRRRAEIVAKKLSASKTAAPTAKRPVARASVPIARSPAERLVEVSGRTTTTHAAFRAVLAKRLSPSQLDEALAPLGVDEATRRIIDAARFAVVPEERRAFELAVALLATGVRRASVERLLSLKLPKVGGAWPSFRDIEWAVCAVVLANAKGLDERYDPVLRSAFRLFPKAKRDLDAIADALPADRRAALQPARNSAK